MSFAFIIDDLLRRSLMARYVPIFKKKIPRLYSVGLKFRNILFPLGSEFNLTRYQIHALNRFIKFVHPDLSECDILEIASDNDGNVLREFEFRGTRSVTGINPDPAMWTENSSGVKRISKKCVLMNLDVRELPFENEQFSSIFSTAAFEHVNELDKALAEMYRVIKPGGYVYADFGPIWSCSVGHHVCAEADGEEAHHWQPGKNPVPHYAHLLFSRDDLKSKLLNDKVSLNLSDAIIEWIYEKKEINRLFFEDYTELFNNSPFEIIQLNTIQEHIEKDILRVLSQKHTGYKEFGVRSVEVLLKKI